MMLAQSRAISRTMKICQQTLMLTPEFFMRVALTGKQFLSVN
jgi:hypothetical protein